MEKAATMTVEAYGLTQKIAILGADHRKSGAINQEETMGKSVLGTLDRMKLGEGVDADGVYHRIQG